MADERVVRGLSELQTFLDQLPVKMEANVMRGALRAGMKEVLPVARQNIHSVSGQLAQGLSIGTRKRGATVIAYLKAKGAHAHVARFVEFGTKAHRIAAKAMSSLFFGGAFAKSVEHPGARPHPFMRVALDRQATAAVVATGEYIRDRLASKHGLDTAGIVIQGDEQ